MANQVAKSSWPTLNNYWLINVPRWHTVKTVHLAIAFENEPFAKKGPTTVQKLPAKNYAKINTKLEKPLLPFSKHFTLVFIN